MLKTGQTVNFDFSLCRALGGARRAGTGVICGETVVGTDDARMIRVVSSENYEAGEVLDVRNKNIFAA